MDTNQYRTIIELAIENEVEAYEFYASVAAKTADASLKQIFDELAQEEKGHREMLTAMLNNPDKPLNFSCSPDYGVAGTVETPRLSITMKPADAIALAMKKEEEAMTTYQNFASASDSAEQAGVFEQLARMEQGHKARLEDMYTNMAFPEIW